MDKAELLLNKVIPVSINKLLLDDNSDFFLMENNHIKHKDKLRERFNEISKEYLNGLLKEKEQYLLELKVKEELLKYTLTMLEGILSHDEKEKLKSEIEIVMVDINNFSKEFKNIQNLENVLYSVFK
ncbi:MULTISPECIES: hypothetical protein [unclassified Sporosarcina]|uniref:hypothetical protein n=1 Tax=unclassified Sporosarcina TaxID=2647733 RepID=UPI00203DFEC5|nr:MULTISPECIES: hypothetical protein [unclassified Sporosarcina]GKV64089.1 hypothetical protein NCCP2331_02420 [Sporosarcina sp. NCCP-2331]GLB54446.1 hypothetical protein NCCP2378_02310 [Sporosarcina sp. NCCP-2378]